MPAVAAVAWTKRHKALKATPDSKLGKMSDGELAKLLGVSRPTVTRRRTARGIAPLGGKAKKPPPRAKSAAEFDANGDRRLEAAAHWTPLDSLTPWEDNPRDNDGRSVDEVLALFKRFGWGAPMVVSAGGIAAGHTRLKAATRLREEWLALEDTERARLRQEADTFLEAIDAWNAAGRDEDQFPEHPEWHPEAIRVADRWEGVVRVKDDWSTKDAHLYALADNRSHEHAGWQQPKLLELFDRYEHPEINLAGWNDIEIADLRTGPEPPAPPLEQDEVPEPPAQPITKPGDIWILGDHRLVCGDSTDGNTWAALMGDDSAHALITDPPYVVAYDGGPNGKRDAIANDALKPEQLTQFLTEVLVPCCNNVVPGAPYYVFGPSVADLSKAFLDALANSGFLLKHGLVWVKDTLVFGRADYHYQHETVWYGWKPGAAHYFGGTPKDTSLLEFARPKASDEHPTMKPVELVGHLVVRAAKSGNIVLDPFSGSGTTIISCEQIDRIGRGIELEPKYCDVIVERWQNLTGGKATRESAKVAV